MSKPHFRRTSDGATYRVADGYRNMVANLGTDRDKAAWGGYFLRVLTPVELLNAYRSSWLPRKIVDIPALDATRKWRAWQADPKQITALEKEEKRLNVREKTKAAMTAARLFGGAALYIGTGDNSPIDPFQPERVKRGGIRSLTVLTPNQITPGELDRDIESAYYGTPATYRITTAQGTTLDIHPSRLVVFDGAPIPDPFMVGQGWADSVLQSILNAIHQADSTSANVASLVFEAKIDVIHIPGLMAQIASQEGEDLVSQRLMLGARAKGVNGTLVLDGGGTDSAGKPTGREEFEQKQISFGTLPDLMIAFFQNVSGAADIPMTRLFGRSAAGMNATGEGDERSYYDRIQAMQELEMQPSMALLDEALMFSALGSRPEEIHYRWNPLRQVTEKERAEIFKANADAARALAGSGGASPVLLPLEALSDALANRLIEDGALPGLEAALEEFGGLGEEDEDDLGMALPAPPQQETLT